MTRDEIFKNIQEILVDALGVDEEEVTPTARLQADLGAESIDYLDISFKIEQVFGIKIAQGELFPDGSAQNAGLVKDGKITPEGIALLKGKLPHVDFSSWESDPQVAKVGNLFTVNVLVNFVERKLAAAGGA